jgi:predicted HTH domain antitoxin
MLSQIGEEGLMSTDELTIRYPAGLERAVHLTKAELEQHLRLMAALKMFELGKLSSGKAAELAGIPRAGFFEACGRYRVSIFNYADEEIETELAAELATMKKIQPR